MKILLKKRNIFIIAGVLLLAVFVGYLAIFLFKTNRLNNLNALGEAINNVSLGASDLEDISLDDLIPQELLGDDWEPKISPQVNFVPDEDITIKKPIVTLQAPEVKAKGIDPNICGQFAPLPSCNNVPSPYKETCLQCRAQ